MINKTNKDRLFFYWASSFVIAYSMYYVLWLIMPNHLVFGALYRMFLYHCAFPMQYIALACFFYGVIAMVLSNKFETANTPMRILITILIIALTILISSPFGGMLWHFHDMYLGYFPDKWFSKMVIKGFSWGLETGWLIIALSIPYNIFGCIACYFITIKGVERYN